MIAASMLAICAWMSSCAGGSPRWLAAPGIDATPMLKLAKLAGIPAVAAAVLGP